MEEEEEEEEDDQVSLYMSHWSLNSTTGTLQSVHAESFDVSMHFHPNQLPKQDASF